MHHDKTVKSSAVSKIKLIKLIFFFAKKMLSVRIFAVAVIIIAVVKEIVRMIKQRALDIFLSAKIRTEHVNLVILMLVEPFMISLVNLLRVLFGELNGSLAQKFILEKMLSDPQILKKMQKTGDFDQYHLTAVLNRHKEIFFSGSDILLFHIPVVIINISLTAVVLKLHRSSFYRVLGIAVCFFIIVFFLIYVRNLFLTPINERKIKYENRYFSKAGSILECKELIQQEEQLVFLPYNNLNEIYSECLIQLTKVALNFVYLISTFLIFHSIFTLESFSVFFSIKKIMSNVSELADKIVDFDQLCSEIRNEELIFYE
ncbi:hypothetical protein NUSPORA_02520 [Nucleospora cyclopteri]